MRIRLTPGLQAMILQFIRAGSYDWVAAEAAGVPRSLFEHWLRVGEASPRRPYREFFYEVMRARAEARVAAELTALKKDARFWLRYGPGRDRPDQPGWGTRLTPVDNASAAAEPFASLEFNRLLAALSRALEPFPEARVAAAKALQPFHLRSPASGKARQNAMVLDRPPPSTNGANGGPEPTPPPSPNGANGELGPAPPPSTNGVNGGPEPMSPPSPNGANGGQGPSPPPSTNGANRELGPAPPPSTNGANGGQGPSPPPSPNPPA